MSKINVQFDTVSKDLDVTLDGEKVENVSSIEIYAYKEGSSDKGYVELRTVELLEDDKIVKVTRLSADGKIVVVNENLSSEESVAQKQLHKDISEAIKPRFHKLP